MACYPPPRGIDGLLGWVAKSTHHHPRIARGYARRGRSSLVWECARSGRSANEESSPTKARLACSRPRYLARRLSHGCPTAGLGVAETLQGPSPPQPRRGGLERGKHKASMGCTREGTVRRRGLSLFNKSPRERTSCLGGRTARSRPLTGCGGLGSDSCRWGFDGLGALNADPALAPWVRDGRGTVRLGNTSARAKRRAC